MASTRDQRLTASKVSTQITTLTKITRLSTRDQRLTASKVSTQ